MIKELILKNRSYRRFYEDKLIEMSTLKELVNLARLSPSGGNIQALRYILGNTKEQNDKINKHIFWAGYYKEWDGPKDGEKPSAYMVVVKDTTVGKSLPQDEGIAVQSILLGAVENGLGGCIIANVNKKKLAEELNLDEKTGAKVILKALESPLYYIAANAGLEGAVIINKVKESEPGMGFNAASEEYVNMVEAGILDPVKVTRSALQNATSVASTLLTTESVVANIKEDVPAMPAGNPGMGMM